MTPNTNKDNQSEDFPKFVLFTSFAKSRKKAIRKHSKRISENWDTLITLNGVGEMRDLNLLLLEAQNRNKLYRKELKQVRKSKSDILCVSELIKMEERSKANLLSVQRAINSLRTS